jgi:hypothetical protein
MQTGIVQVYTIGPEVLVLHFVQGTQARQQALTPHSVTSVTYVTVRADTS